MLTPRYFGGLSSCFGVEGREYGRRSPSRLIGEHLVVLAGDLGGCRRFLRGSGGLGLQIEARGRVLLRGCRVPRGERGFGL